MGAKETKREEWNDRACNDQTPLMTLVTLVTYTPKYIQEVFDFD